MSETVRTVCEFGLTTIAVLGLVFVLLATAGPIYVAVRNYFWLRSRDVRNAWGQSGMGDIGDYLVMIVTLTAFIIVALVSREIK